MSIKKVAKSKTPSYSISEVEDAVFRIRDQSNIEKMKIVLSDWKILGNINDFFLLLYLNLNCAVLRNKIVSQEIRNLMEDMIMRGRRYFEKKELEGLSMEERDIFKLINSLSSEKAIFFEKLYPGGYPGNSETVEALSFNDLKEFEIPIFKYIFIMNIAECLRKESENMSLKFDELKSMVIFEKIKQVYLTFSKLDSCFIAFEFTLRFMCNDYSISEEIRNEFFSTTYPELVCDIPLSVSAEYPSLKLRLEVCHQLEKMFFDCFPYQNKPRSYKRLFSNVQNYYAFSDFYSNVRILDPTASKTSEKPNNYHEDKGNFYYGSEVVLPIPDNFNFVYMEISDGYAFSNNPFFNDNFLIHHRGRIVGTTNAHVILNLGGGFLKIKGNSNELILYLGKMVLNASQAEIFYSQSQKMLKREENLVRDNLCFLQKKGRILCWKQYPVFEFKDWKNNNENGSSSHFTKYSKSQSSNVGRKMSSFVQCLYESSQFSILEDFSKCLHHSLETESHCYDLITFPNSHFNSFSNAYQEYIINLFYILNCRGNDFNKIPKDVLAHKIIPYLDQEEIFYSVHKNYYKLMMLDSFSRLSYLTEDHFKKKYFDWLKTGFSERHPVDLSKSLVMFRLYLTSTNKDWKDQVFGELGISERKEFRDMVFFTEDSVIVDFFHYIFVECDLDDTFYRRVRIEIFKFLSCLVFSDFYLMDDRNSSSPISEERRIMEVIISPKLLYSLTFIIHQSEERESIKAVIKDIIRYFFLLLVGSDVIETKEEVGLDRISISCFKNKSIPYNDLERFNESKRGTSFDLLNSLCLSPNISSQLMLIPDCSRSCNLIFIKYMYFFQLMIYDIFGHNEYSFNDSSHRKRVEKGVRALFNILSKTSEIAHPLLPFFYSCFLKILSSLLLFRIIPKKLVTEEEVEGENESENDQNNQKAVYEQFHDVHDVHPFYEILRESFDKSFFDPLRIKKQGKQEFLSKKKEIGILFEYIRTLVDVIKADELFTKFIQGIFQSINMVEGDFVLEIQVSYPRRMYPSHKVYISQITPSLVLLGFVDRVFRMKQLIISNEKYSDLRTFLNRAKWKLISFLLRNLRYKGSEQILKFSQKRLVIITHVLKIFKSLLSDRFFFTDPPLIGTESKTINDDLTEKKNNSITETEDSGMWCRVMENFLSFFRKVCEGEKILGVHHVSLEKMRESCKTINVVLEIMDLLESNDFFIENIRSIYGCRENDEQNKNAMYKRSKLIRGHKNSVFSKSVVSFLSERYRFSENADREGCREGFRSLLSDLKKFVPGNCDPENLVLLYKPILLIDCVRGIHLYVGEECLKSFFLILFDIVFKLEESLDPENHLLKEIIEFVCQNYGMFTSIPIEASDFARSKMIEKLEILQKYFLEGKSFASIDTRLPFDLSIFRMFGSSSNLCNLDLLRAILKGMELGDLRIMYDHFQAFEIVFNSLSENDMNVIFRTPESMENESKSSLLEDIANLVVKNIRKYIRRMDKKLVKFLEILLVFSRNFAFCDLRKCLSPATFDLIFDTFLYNIVHKRRSKKRIAVMGLRTVVEFHISSYDVSSFRIFSLVLEQGDGMKENLRKLQRNNYAIISSLLQIFSRNYEKSPSKTALESLKISCVTIFQKILTLDPDHFIKSLSYDFFGINHLDQIFKSICRRVDTDKTGTRKKIVISKKKKKHENNTNKNNFSESFAHVYENFILSVIKIIGDKNRSHLFDLVERNEHFQKLFNFYTYSGNLGSQSGVGFSFLEKVENLLFGFGIESYQIPWRTTQYANNEALFRKPRDIIPQHSEKREAENSWKSEFDWKNEEFQSFSELESSSKGEEKFLDSQLCFDFENNNRGLEQGGNGFLFEESEEKDETNEPEKKEEDRKETLDDFLLGGKGEFEIDGEKNEGKEENGENNNVDKNNGDDVFYF